MRWLLKKDLIILRRSPVLLALLVLYPVIISTLIGFALSRGPDKPKVAFVNLVPDTAREISLGGDRVDVSAQAGPLFRAIDPVRVKTREEAIEKVRDGEVLGALIIPEDTTEKLQSGVEPATVEVFYNAEDPVKARYVRDTIKSQVQDANNALTKRLSKVALEFLGLIATGGDYNFLGREFDVLGLQNSEEILAEAKKELPKNSKSREDVERVISFARLARENLDLSDDVLASVGTPIRVKQEALDGGTTPLSEFAIAIAVAVSLMFITLLLAAGALAIEREENAFLRLVRGLVSHTGLLVEKTLLATICGTAVSITMLCVIGAFVDVKWSNVPVAAGVGVIAAVAFAAAGLALGGFAKDVRAASLLCVMLALPLAFLALVPSGSVSKEIYDVIRTISALFPFDPALDGLDKALNDKPQLGEEFVHLGILALVYGALARLALRRFAR